VQKAGVRRSSGLRSVGWWFVAVFALELVIDVLHSGLALVPAGKFTKCLRDTLLARTAGVAVNVLTPTATVGGESSGELLLLGSARRRFRVGDGRQAFALSQAIFLSTGMLAVFTGLSFDAKEEALASARSRSGSRPSLPSSLQRAGIFRSASASCGRFSAAPRSSNACRHAATFDTKVATFLRTRRELALRSDFTCSLNSHGSRSTTS
jgi:hypothetical protein